MGEFIEYKKKPAVVWFDKPRPPSLLYKKIRKVGKGVDGWSSVQLLGVRHELSASVQIFILYEKKKKLTKCV